MTGINLKASEGLVQGPASQGEGVDEDFLGTEGCHLCGQIKQVGKSPGGKGDLVGGEGRGQGLTG